MILFTIIMSIIGLTAAFVTIAEIDSLGKPPLVGRQKLLLIAPHVLIIISITLLAAGVILL